MMKTVSRAEQAMFYASVNVQYFWNACLKDGITLSTMKQNMLCYQWQLEICRLSKDWCKQYL